MPKEPKRGLTVNILFESSRIKEIYLKEAYEKLLPPTKKIIEEIDANNLISNYKISYFKQQGK